MSACYLVERVCELAPECASVLAPLRERRHRWTLPTSTDTAVRLCREAAALTEHPDRRLELGVLARYLRWELSTDDLWVLADADDCCLNDLIAPLLPGWFLVCDDDMLRMFADRYFASNDVIVREVMGARLVERANTLDGSARLLPV